MMVSEEIKQKYINKIYKEMRLRGMTEEEIPEVIAKTGFMDVMKDCPEAQLHYHPEDAVDEILLIAALH